MVRALLVSWCSFSDNKATIGDAMACEVARQWFEEFGVECDVAASTGAVPEIDVWRVPPERYKFFVFVCGPWIRGGLTDRLIARFSSCIRIGLNLTIWDKDWHCFDFVIPRDDGIQSNPDYALAHGREVSKVCGLFLIHPQPPYGARQRHDQVVATIKAAVSRWDLAALSLDTLIMDNPTPWHKRRHIEALTARCDFIITTRLHGLIIALRHGIPAIAVDPIAEGAKVSAQARALDWPLAFTPETLTDAALDAAMEQCLESTIDTTLRQVNAVALQDLQNIRERLKTFVDGELRR